MATPIPGAAISGLTAKKIFSCIYSYEFVFFRMSTSLSDILATHGLHKNALKEAVAKEDKLVLAKRIKDWKAVGVALGFTQEDLDLYDDAFETDELKKNNIIIQWTVKHRKEATYLKLAQVLFDGGMTDLLKVLCAILKKSTPTNSASVESGQYNN